MSGPSVRLRLPPLAIFEFPPANEPRALPPPSSGSSFASPFPINERLYNAVLQPYVPLTIASVYLVTILVLNKGNRDAGGKPWKISKTRGFFAFVLAHNIFLAVFSAATFVGMLRALRHSWPSHREYEWLGILWPGLRTQGGLAGAVDALCQLHGPRGLGNAVTYSGTRGAWEFRNPLFKLATDGSPDSTDVGRIWNEGLAFWGWFFYLSKFYEVVDTLIILMQGKISSTLQVYHHMGAMLAMWAGMRYMGPPIWMFCFLNSGIHTLMYLYYTLSALNIRAPRRIKKTLTTMQISQFLIGILFATAHMFVEYTVPVTALQAGKHGLKVVTASLMEAYSTMSSEAVAATATAGLDAWAKKLIYRAAGQEGLAENVRNQNGEAFGPEADHVRDAHSRTSTSESATYQTVPCLNTASAAFAVWLNIVYLAPLTWLFLRFFFRSYSKRTSPKTAQPTKQHRISESANEAGRDVKRETDRFGRKAEDGLDSAVQKTKKTVDENPRINEAIDKTKENVTSVSNAAVDQGKKLGEKAKKQTQESLSGLSEKGAQLQEQAKDQVSKTGKNLSDKAGQLQDQAQAQASKTGKSLSQKSSQLSEQGKTQASKTGKALSEEGSQLQDQAVTQASKVSNDLKEKASETRKQASAKAEEVKNTADKTSQQTTNKSGSHASGKPESESEPTTHEVLGKGDVQPEEAQALDGVPNGPEDSTVLVEKEDGAEGSFNGLAPPPSLPETNGEDEATHNVNGSDEVDGLSADNFQAQGAPSYAEKVK